MLLLLKYSTARVFETLNIITSFIAIQMEIMILKNKPSVLNDEVELTTNQMINVQYFQTILLFNMIWLGSACKVKTINGTKIRSN